MEITLLRYPRFCCLCWLFIFTKMKIKNLCLLSLLLLTSCYGTGVVTKTAEIDPITNSKIIRTSPVDLQNRMTTNFGTPLFTLTGVKIDGVKVLDFDIDIIGTKALYDHVEKNSLLQIKTSDGEIFELNSFKSFSPAYRISGITTTTSFDAYYIVPDEIFNELLVKQIVFIRVKLSDVNLDGDISENYDKRFKEVLEQIK